MQINNNLWLMLWINRDPGWDSSVRENTLKTDGCVDMLDLEISWRPEKHVMVTAVFNCNIFTARKRSLRRLCFNTCLSVHGGREYLGRYPPGRYTPRQVHPQAGTPQAGTHTLSRYIPHPPPTPGRCPQQVHLLGRYTPPSHSAWVHAGIRSASGRYASNCNALLL